MYISLYVMLNTSCNDLYKLQPSVPVVTACTSYQDLDIFHRTGSAASAAVVSQFQGPFRHHMYFFTLNLCVLRSDRWSQYICGFFLLCSAGRSVCQMVTICTRSELVSFHFIDMFPALAEGLVLFVWPRSSSLGWCPNNRIINNYTNCMLMWQSLGDMYHALHRGCV